MPHFEQQVHQQEMAIRQLKDRVAKLEKDSHPPIDFIERVAEAINSGELLLDIGENRQGHLVVKKAIIKHD